MHRSLVAGIFVVVASSTGAAAPLEGEYARVLAAHVDSSSGLVDYSALAADEAALKSLDSFASSKLGSDATVNEKLAGKINRYNARVLEQVARGIEEFAAADNGVLSDPQFFDRPLLLEGEKRGLNVYEATIRALGVPAGHFGVNCGSKGCPRLLAEKFEAETVRERLDELEREAILATTRAVNDDGSRVMEVLELFFWYAKDFTGVDPKEDPAGHQALLRKYLLNRIPDRTVEQRALKASLARAPKIRARSDWDWHVNSK